MIDFIDILHEYITYIYYLNSYSPCLCAPPINLIFPHISSLPTFPIFMHLCSYLPIKYLSSTNKKEHLIFIFLHRIFHLESLSLVVFPANNMILFFFIAKQSTILYIQHFFSVHLWLCVYQEEPSVSPPSEHYVLDNIAILYLEWIIQALRKPRKETDSVQQLVQHCI